MIKKLIKHILEPLRGSVERVSLSTPGSSATLRDPGLRTLGFSEAGIRDAFGCTLGFSEAGMIRKLKHAVRIVASLRDAFGRTWGTSLQLLLILVGIMTTGCVNDLAIDEPDAPEEGKMVTVTFAIPAPNNIEGFVSSRALDDGEDTFRNLYVIAAASNGDLTVFPFSQEDLGNKKNNGAYNISVELPKATYTFSIVANIDGYIEGTVSELTTQTQLSTLINYFEPIKPITYDNLPMAILGTNQIDLNKTTNLSAVLSILCAKVRYTILFDARENCISSSFGERRIRMMFEGDDSQPYLSFNGNDKDMDLPLDRYVFIDGKQALTSLDYDRINLADYITPYTPGSMTIEQWESMKYKAWQGTIYLSKSNITPTLYFPYQYIKDSVTSGISSKSVQMENALVNGNSYEIIIKITDYNKFEESITTSSGGDDATPKTYRIYFVDDGSNYTSVYVDWEGLSESDRNRPLNNYNLTDKLKYRYFEFDSDAKPNTFGYKFPSIFGGYWDEVSGLSTVNFKEVNGKWIGYYDGQTLSSGYPIKIKTNDVIHLFLRQSLQMTYAYLWYGDWSNTSSPLGQIYTETSSNYYVFVVKYTGEDADYINFYLTANGDRSKNYCFIMDDIRLYDDYTSTGPNEWRVTIDSLPNE